MVVMVRYATLPLHGMDLEWVIPDYCRHPRPPSVAAQPILPSISRPSVAIGPTFRVDNTGRPCPDPGLLSPSIPFFGNFMANSYMQLCQQDDERIEKLFC